MNIREKLKAITNQIPKTVTEMPAIISIPRDHVDKRERFEKPLRMKRDYFRILVNEMYLPHTREWLIKYDPLLLVASEFNYHRGKKIVPYLVGRVMLDDLFPNQDIPQKMVFSNTKVAGLHPYRGESITISMILCSMDRENYAKEMLSFIEKTAKVLDPSTIISTFLEVSNVVLDGVYSLMKSGSTQGVMGFNKSFDPIRETSEVPGHFVLLNKKMSEVDKNEFWVRGSQLYHGPSMEASVPYEDTEFVLFEISGTDIRSDEESLSFYPQFEHVIDEAGGGTPNHKESAKYSLISLSQTMRKHPDLTGDHAKALVEKYKAEMMDAYNQAREIKDLGRGDTAEEDLIRRESFEILDL